MEDGPQRGEAKDRRVLIIAYYWPPAGGPGVQRWLKFSKYLPDNGWAPTLLVPAGAAYPVLDPSLEKDVPEHLEVHRVPILEPYEFAMKVFSSKGGAERLGSSKSDDVGQGFAKRLMLWCRGNLLLPDPRVLWRRRAGRRALDLIRKAALDGHPFEAVVTTGPPHSIHLIGLDLKRRTGLPWLADFRDLWREMDYLEDFLPTNRTRRKHAQLERAVVAGADAITYTSPGTKASLMQNAPEVTEERFHLVYNGWDPADLANQSVEGAAGGLPDDGVLHLGHFGSLFPTRDAPGLWRAIRHWNAGNVNGRSKVHLDLVGSISPPVRASIEALMSPEEWTDHGYVSHGAAVDMMQRMDALLLIQNDNATGQRAIPGKAFEYLAAGRPMGVIAPVPSDLADLADQWELSPCHHQDEEGATTMLEKLCNGTGTETGLAARYSRPALTTEMGRVLLGIIPSTTH